MSKIEEVNLAEVDYHNNPPTTEELASRMSPFGVFKPMLSAKTNEAVDFYDYTQSMRQAVVDRFLGRVNEDGSISLREVDIEALPTLTGVLRDIDSATSKLERARREQEALDTSQDTNAIVRDLLAHIKDTKLTKPEHVQGTIPVSELDNTPNVYLEGENTPVDPDNTLNDVNFFLAKMNVNPNKSDD